MQRIRYGVGGFFSANLPNGKMFVLKPGLNEVTNEAWKLAQKIPGVAEKVATDEIKGPGVSPTMARVLTQYSRKLANAGTWPFQYIDATGAEVDTSEHTLEALQRHKLVDGRHQITRKGVMTLQRLRKAADK